MRYRGILGGMLIIGALLIFAGCGKQSEFVDDNEESTVAIEESTEFVESIEEFEENGEKFYRENTENLEIVYRQFDKKILNKEEIVAYKPVDLSKGGSGDIIRAPIYLLRLNIKNIYDSDSISKVNLTLYNCSAYLKPGKQDLQKDSNLYRLCDTVAADLSSDVMAEMHVLFELKEMRAVEENAKKAAIVDKAIIQADITYTDNTTKTEYLSLGSYEGRHCNFMSIYRLEVEE